MSTESTNDQEGRQSIGAAFVVRFYRHLGSETVRFRIRRWIVACEGGQAHSGTIRRLLGEIYGVQVGLYTSGPWLRKPQVFHRGTTIGRYTSIADTVRTFTRNHPRNTMSTHGLFYNPALGLVKGAPLAFNSLQIGHGARLGDHVIVLPPTKQIGIGAVVTAGSVVYSDIPAYAVATGNPAQVTGYRFGKEVIGRLIDSRWWERSPTELASNCDRFRQLWAAREPGGLDAKLELKGQPHPLSL